MQAGPTKANEECEHENVIAYMYENVTEKGWFICLSVCLLDRVSLFIPSGLELAVETRLASNSKWSICLCLQIARIEFVIFENTDDTDKQKLDNYIGQELWELFWGGSDQWDFC